MATIIDPMAFTFFGMLGAFGGGFAPAIQSVALEIYTQRGGTEAGRLFGALSVLQALRSVQILFLFLHFLIDEIVDKLLDLHCMALCI